MPLETWPPICKGLKLQSLSGKHCVQLRAAGIYFDFALGFVSVSAAFFQDCISEQDLDEMNIEIIRNTLYKVNVAPLWEGRS